MSYVKNFLSKTIDQWEEYAHTHEDESCVSVNLNSDYFDLGNAQSEDIMDRNERRFDRYIQKKYKSAQKNGTLMSTTDWDKSLGEHPALAKPNMESILIDRELRSLHGFEMFWRKREIFRKF